jgi:hypothetical protein
MIVIDPLRKGAPPPNSQPAISAPTIPTTMSKMKSTAGTGDDTRPPSEQNSNEKHVRSAVPGFC